MMFVALTREAEIEIHVFILFFIIFAKFSLLIQERRELLSFPHLLTFKGLLSICLSGESMSMLMLLLVEIDLFEKLLCLLLT